MKHANEQKLCGKLFQTPYTSMSFILHFKLSLMFPTETTNILTSSFTEYYILLYIPSLTSPGSPMATPMAFLAKAQNVANMLCINYSSIYKRQK